MMPDNFKHSTLDFSSHELITKACKAVKMADTEILVSILKPYSSDTNKFGRFLVQKFKIDGYPLLEQD